MAPAIESVVDTGPGESLRATLRAATMAAHDLLDHAMQAASGWQTRGDYARFLALQYAARLPLEVWLADHAPSGIAPPPLQTGLLARDLRALGTPLPPACPPFDPAYPPASPAFSPVFHVKHGWVGAAWVLAGSALGNKAIARQVARIGGGQWPVNFLGDDAMMTFWQALRARIEAPALPGEAAAATFAAQAVFAHFLHTAQGCDLSDLAAESILA